MNPANTRALGVLALGVLALMVLVIGCSQAAEKGPLGGDLPNPSVPLDYSDTFKNQNISVSELQDLYREIAELDWQLHFDPENATIKGEIDIRLVEARTKICYTQCTNVPRYLYVSDRVCCRDKSNEVNATYRGIVWANGCVYKRVAQIAKLEEEFTGLEETLKNDSENLTTLTSLANMARTLSKAYSPSADLVRVDGEFLERWDICTSPAREYVRDRSNQTMSEHYNEFERVAKSVVSRIQRQDREAAEEAAREREKEEVRGNILSEIARHNESISANPSDHSIWYRRGLAYMSLAKYYQWNDSTKEALKSFQSAIKTAGSKVPIYYWIDEGNAHYNLGDYKAALDSYETAITKAHSSSDSGDNLYYIWGLYAKARIYEATDPDKAIAYYLLILASDNEYDYRIWEKLSRLYKQQGKYSDAIDAKSTADLLKTTVRRDMLPRLPTFSY